MRQSHCAVITTTGSAEGAKVLAREIVDAALPLAIGYAHIGKVLSWSSCGKSARIAPGVTGSPKFTSRTRLRRALPMAAGTASPGRGSRSCDPHPRGVAHLGRAP